MFLTADYLVKLNLFDENSMQLGHQLYKEFRISLYILRLKYPLNTLKYVQWTMAKQMVFVHLERALPKNAARFDHCDHG